MTPLEQKETRANCSIVKIGFHIRFFFASVAVLVATGGLAYAQTVNQTNPNGYNKIYYPNGQISSEGMMKDGKPDGYWKTYYVTGMMKSEGNRRNSMLDSTWVFYTETGDTAEIIHYIAGRKSGYYYHYATTTEKNSVSVHYLKSRDLYVDDRKEGTSLTFFPSGKVQTTTPYRNGKRQGTGLEYDEHGVVITMFEYRNDYMVSRDFINRKDAEGRKTGTWREFYDNGAIKEEHTYKDGVLEGPTRLYASTGKLLSDRTYKDGSIVDEGVLAQAEAEEIIDYYKDGITPRRKGIYIGKVPIGMHIFYDEKGVAYRGVRFSADGKKTAEGPVNAAEKRDGAWTLFYEDGATRAKGAYLNDRQNGVWQFFYAAGGQEQSGSFENGVMTGEWKWFNAKGTLLREETYINGQLNGPTVHYNDSATVIAKGTYAAGEPEGQWVVSIGDVRDEGEYMAGLKNGMWKTYYDNGQLYHKGSFVQGNPNGRHEFYYPDGRIKEEQFYVNGRREGNWKKYYDNGSLFLTVTYRNDNEVRINGVRIDR